MSKKVIAVVSGIAALLIGAAILVFVPRDTIIVTSTPSWLPSSGNYYVSNPVLKIKLPLFSMNDDELEAISEERNRLLEQAYDRVLASDSQAFQGEFTSIENIAFELGAYTYYFRTPDVDNVYKFNKNTDEITAVPLSGYNGFSDGTSKERFGEVTHNFTAFVSIRTEALTDYFPGLKQAIEDSGNNFYYSYTYYDNGRVFFETDNTIYEYLPDSDSTRKIASVGRDETVEMVMDIS